MTDAAPDTVSQLVLRHRPETPPALAEALGRFATALLAANQNINLTGITDPEGMAIRHMIDALTALPLLDALPEGSRLLDLGSGGGVPGIPLALARPDLEVALAESRQRKAGALQSIVDELDLSPRVEVVAERAEDWLADHRVDAVISRAVGTVAAQIALLKPVAASVGRLILMKGPNVDEELASQPWRRTPFGAPKRVETELPAGGGRRVLLEFRT
jgi:16S rRNA (guanine527-N7)-methyltransferase